MAEKELLSAEGRGHLASVGSADLAVALIAPDGGGPDALAAASDGLSRDFPELRSVVLRVHAGGPSGEPAASRVVDLAVRPTSGGPGAWRAVGLHTALQAAERLQVQAIAVLDADVTSLSPDWVGRLLRPVLDREIDLAAPYYVRHPFQGAVNSGMLYPLTRALSGRRLRFPLGGEFACSRRLVAGLMARNVWQSRDGVVRVDPWIIATTDAGWRVAQAVLGPRTTPAEAGADLTSILTGAVAPIFAEMQRSTAYWQKVRGSTPVELSGQLNGAGENPAIEGKRLLDGFRLGQQNLREIWGTVLPPSILVELKKLAQLPDAGFRLPDGIWARIVYDFSLAFAQRSMSRDHLLGALAPLYLGWFGSLVAEMGDAPPDRVENRLEQLCQQFEAEKPYLISRWRWPDRFNP